MPLLPETYQEGPIRFAGHSEIMKLVQSQLGIISKFVPQLTAALSEEITESQSSWKDKQDDYIRFLSREYKEGTIGLFLGSGVSKSADLPEWKGLLVGLMRSVVRKSVAEGSLNSKDEESACGILSSLFGNDQPIITAGNIEQALGEGEYLPALREALYPLGSAFESPLLDEIAEICDDHDIHGYGRSVVTFNFDDLLEQRLRAKGIRHRVYSGEGKRPLLQDAVRIFHVHGYVPFRADAEGTGKLVLSENRYHDLYADSYTYANMEQLELLRNATCIIIGCSLTDPNQRRLLAIAAASPGDARLHYAFVKRTKSIPDGSRNLDTASKALANFVFDKYHAMTEAFLFTLGVNVIWFEEFEDIPPILRRIRGA